MAVIQMFFSFFPSINTLLNFSQPLLFDLISINVTLESFLLINYLINSLLLISLDSKLDVCPEVEAKYSLILDFFNLNHFR
jgi:hypothetical protein